MNKVALFIAIALCGCQGSPLSEIQTSNADFSVAFLFVHDGCKVYRFMDSGSSHYFARCDGASARTSTLKPIGKATYLEEIETPTP